LQLYQNLPQKYKQILQPPMRSTLTEKYLPKKLDPEELDDLLARGWYRMGAEIFTSKYLFFNNRLYSPTWLRLPLHNYQFRKSIRKIFNRNNRKYRVTFGLQNLTAEKNKLYQKYRQNFHSPLSLTLISNLQDAAKKTAFDTWECCVYEGDKLIACSFFDLGGNSLMSILGIFDHDYASDSLGFYTMLLEIDFGIKNGYEFFYPGYIIPGYEKFDYKNRIGKPEELQFLEVKTDRWQYCSDYDESETLTLKIRSKLIQLGKQLQTKGVSVNLLFYPCFDEQLIDYYKLHGMKSPLFLSVFSDFFLQPRFIIYYDFFEEVFHFYECISIAKKGATKNRISNASEPFDFLEQQNLITQHTDIEVIINKVKELHLRILANAMARMEQFKPPSA